MRFSEFRLNEVEDTDSQDADNQNDSESGSLTAGPPYPTEQIDTVRKLQRRLEDLGYSVGSTGIDGKYGPRTARAVSAFKKDNNLQDSDRGRSMSSSDLQKVETANRVANPSPTGNPKSFNPDEIADLNFGGQTNLQAKQVASKYLGREISDREWNFLVRATVAEASPDPLEQAAVMAVILNRAKSSRYPNDIIAVLTQQNQFQAVTGTRHDPGPSRWFRNPSARSVASVVQATIDHLENSNRSWLNFTANDPRAYGPGTNIGFRQTVAQSPGSKVIGGTVFGTV